MKFKESDYEWIYAIKGTTFKLAYAKNTSMIIHVESGFVYPMWAKGIEGLEAGKELCFKAWDALKIVKYDEILKAMSKKPLWIVAVNEEGMLHWFSSDYKKAISAEKEKRGFKTN